MNSDTEQVLVKFRSKGALIDTNLLLLFLIGSYDAEIVKRAQFKRVAQYSHDDFISLVSLLRTFKICVTTPHILAEVSNLAGQLPEGRKADCFRTFGRVFGSFSEHNRASLELTSRPEFIYLGLTDCGIADAASRYLVITDDLKLHSALGHAGHTALNFNHIRTLAWQD